MVVKFAFITESSWCWFSNQRLYLATNCICWRSSLHWSPVDNNREKCNLSAPTKKNLWCSKFQGGSSILQIDPSHGPIWPLQLGQFSPKNGCQKQPLFNGAELTLSQWQTGPTRFGPFFGAKSTLHFTVHKRNDVKLDFLFSQYELSLNRGYVDIPELKIETSSFKAVFAQIIVKC